METAIADVKAQVEQVLAAFIAHALADPALVAFAAGQRVVTHYTLSDLGLEFYVGFQDGAVVAGLGAPPQPAEVRIKAGAATLDNILRGQIRPPTALPELRSSYGSYPRPSACL